MELRKPNSNEFRLIEFLIGKGKEFHPPQEWQVRLLVQDMEDGGMGSLLLFPSDKIFEKRAFGSQVSECQFVDTDGVQVIASLNADQKGELFELDVWKTNFERLISIPEQL